MMKYLFLFLLLGGTKVYGQAKRDTSYKDTIARNYIRTARQEHIASTALQFTGAGLMCTAFLMAADRPGEGFPLQSSFVFVGGVCVLLGIFEAYNADIDMRSAKDRITGDDLKKEKARKDKEKKEKEKEKLKNKKVSFYIGPLGGGLVYRF